MNIISIINTKGGVGKTVTTVHLGAALARLGRRVLLIDIDLQHGLTTYFDIDTTGAPTTTDVLLDGAAIEDAARQLRDNLFAVPATAQMESTENELTMGAGGEVRLRRAFRRLLENDCAFDYVLIDCPSGYGTVTRNALLASRWLLVPVNSEPASYHTAIATIGAAGELAEYHDHSLQVLGVLITEFRATNAARTVVESARAEWNDKVFDATIRRAEKINDLGIIGQTLSDGSKGGSVAHDYEALACEVEARIAKAEAV